MNASLVEERSTHSKVECALKEKQLLCSQLQEKCDTFKGELRAAIAGMFYELSNCFLNIVKIQFLAKVAVEARLLSVQKELDAERLVNNSLESKLSSLSTPTKNNDASDGEGSHEPIVEKVEAGEEVLRLKEELCRLQSQLHLEKSGQLDDNEHWKVFFF